MASNHNLGGNYWGYLIKEDKSATPLLEQLCHGLAKIIGQLEPANAGPKNKLTPKRLAAFYKSVGGNYDNLFSTSDRGLSFMYSTLGCWHTLQPTANAYEPPTIPALTSLGFVKWQTIQILLSPEFEVPVLQEAVKIYDVPRPDGGVFPKHIPREAFPDKPDEEMERWHKDVSGRLVQESEAHRRLKNSPYPSPYNPAERVDGYFAPNSKASLPQIRRPTRSSRTSSHDQDLAKRRSSVPDAISPGRDGPQWVNDQYGRPVDPKKRNSRSHSAHRASNSPSQQQPSNGSSQTRTSTSSHRPSGEYRPTNGTFANINSVQTHSSSRHRRDRSGVHRPYTPSTVEESSGSDGSSEMSSAGQTSNKKHRRSSLWPPNFLNHKRRHSHDASYVQERKPALPPRPNANGNHSRQRSGTLNSPPRPVSEFQPHPFPLSQRPAGHGVGSGVRFRDDIFDIRREDAVNSAPEFPPSYPPSHPPYAGQARPSMYRPRTVDPPPVNPRQIMDSGPQLAPLTRESSGSSGNGNGNGNGNGTDRTVRRQAGGAPLRMSTVAGVGGRRYPNIEPRSAGERRAPMPVWEHKAEEGDDRCANTELPAKVWKIRTELAPFRARRCPVAHPNHGIRSYATESPAKSSSLTPWLVGTAAIGAAYGGYTYLGKPLSVPAAKDAAKAEVEKANDKTQQTTSKVAPQVFTGGDQGFVDLKLASIEPYNHNTKKFIFELPEKDAVSGLHIASAIVTKFKAPDMEKPVIRPYTPISDESDTGHLDLLVKVYPNGQMSEHMHSMKPGQMLSFKGPIPKYPWSPNKHNHITLIAGGTGITPMYQLARAIFNNPDDKTKVSLVFGNIKEEDILLKEEFQKLENEYPQRFRAFYTLNEPPKSWKYGNGVITKELLKQVIPDPKEENIKIFVCGPPGLCKAISGPKPSPQDQGELSGMLKELGYSKEQVFKF